ncbi:MAG: FecR domain-containing protein [Gammaproteobacteria bacterium]|nr:FecR domain-containing protein [Gammaproteobacteria bacterium]
MSRNYFYPTLTFAMILFSGITTQPANAEIINNSHWLVKPGDSVYSIARKVFPNDKDKQIRLRREVVQNNPDVFKGNPNLMSVGSKLRLPEFSIKKPLVKKVPSPVVITKSTSLSEPTTPKTIPVKSVQTAMPDPEDVIGRVVINIGKLEASNRGGTRKLKRNSNILKGDTIRTAQRAHTQLRMKDGALLSLRPNTEILLAQYDYNGQQDGTERSIIELIRGGFRTITGAIGHRNKKNYQVRTTVATIGIRGTHYGLMLCNSGSCQNNPQADNLQDGLYGGVVDGSVIAENTAGIFSFNNDQYFHIETAQTPPVEILVPPPVFHDAPLSDRRDQDGQADMAQGPGHEPGNGDPQGESGDNRQQGDSRRPGRFNRLHNPMTMLANNPEHQPDRPLPFLPDQNVNTFEQPLPPKAPVGSGMALAFTHLDGTGRNGVGAPIIITPNNGNNIFLENFTTPGGQVIANLPFAIYEQSFDPDGNFQRHEGARLRPDGTGATYVLSSMGGTANFGGVNWGRWNGNYFVRENDAPLIHDQNLHYIYSPNLTTPTELANLGGLRSRIEVYQFAGGTLPTNHLGNVAAVNPAISADIDFVNHQLLSYSVSADIAGINWFGSLTNRVNFTNLNSSFNISGACHNTTCDGEASFLLVGNAAGGAMTSYSLTDPLGGGMSGSALLTPLTLTTTPNNFAALFAFNAAPGDVSFPVLTNSSSVDNIYLSAGNPVIANDRFTDNTGDNRYHNLTINPSQATLFDTGSDASSIPGTTISWGRWDMATVIKDNQVTAVNDALFIQSNNISTPAQLAGLSGSATFTDTVFNGYVNGTTAMGGSVSMDVNFTTNLVTSYTASANESVTVLDGQARNIPFTSLNTGFAISGNSCIPTCTCLNCQGTASVQFVGPNAEGAITSFSIRDNIPNTANGTAVLLNGG